MRQQLLIFLFIGFVSTVNAQIQVSQEPRHHKVLENEYVRVLDVHIPPHDTSMMHKHSTPSVFLILSNTKTGSEVLVEPGKPSFSDGNIWFEGFYDKPRIHRVWNEDTVEFHVMDIELLHTPSATDTAEADFPFSISLFDAKPVHAFKVLVAPQKGFAIKALTSPVLIIKLTATSPDATVNNHPFKKKGDYLFIPAGDPLSINNNSPMVYQGFALLSLK